MKDVIGCRMADIERKETYNPTNREVAFAYQFHDQAQMLYTMAHVSPENFEKQLQITETYIANYRQQIAALSAEGKE